jgi:hypothetical protein
MDSETIEMLNHNKFLAVTIIPYVDEPQKNIKEWDKNDLEEFLNNYHQFAEELILLQPIEENAEKSAQKEKLQQRFEKDA